MITLSPIEKANELIKEHTIWCRECDYEHNAKINSLITTNEIIKLCNKIIHSYPSEANRLEKKYWEDVFNEINKK